MNTDDKCSNCEKEEEFRTNAAEGVEEAEE